MTIVISANTSWYIWNFRLSLIRELLSCGHRVLAVSASDEWTKRLEAVGVSTVSVRLKTKSVNPLRELITLVSYFRAYNRCGASLVLHYTPKANLYGSIAARILGIPVINNVSGLGAAFSKKSKITALVAFLYRHAFRKAYKVFFQNADDRKHFLDAGLVSSGVCTLLPGSGVNLSLYTPCQADNDQFTFLFVGRLLKEKGVEDFLHAAALVKTRTRKPVRFVLAGKHDPSDPHMADTSLLKLFLNNDIIEVTGQVEDIRELLCHADCIVLPSYYREGVPRSLLEGAACGKPLIACDCVGTREPVENGVNGFLCKPEDPEDLASKMMAMLEMDQDTRNRMGRESRRIAESRFDERIVIGEYLKAVESLTACKI